MELCESAERGRACGGCRNKVFSAVLPGSRGRVQLLWWSGKLSRVHMASGARVGSGSAATETHIGLSESVSPVTRHAGTSAFTFAFSSPRRSTHAQVPSPPVGHFSRYIQVHTRFAHGIAILLPPPPV